MLGALHEPSCNPLSSYEAEVRSSIVLRKKLEVREVKWFREEAQGGLILEPGCFLLDYTVLLPYFPLSRQIPASPPGKGRKMELRCADRGRDSMTSWSSSILVLINEDPGKCHL